MRRLAALIALALALAGCAVPHQRDDLALEKSAAQDSEIAAVFARYRTVRKTAISLLDPKPLSTVETGAVFAIDSGSFDVSQRLAQAQEQQSAEIDVVEVLKPRFTRYPLWFVAVVRDPAAGVNRVQLFERLSAVDPFLLVATPETVADTVLPELRKGVQDAVVPAKPADGTGVALSPQDAAEAYAATLDDGTSAEAATVEADSFIDQMRATAAQNAELEDVTFSQSWKAEKVRYALRTADGGALAFVTLERRDTYKVKKGLTVNFPEGSPQQAFLATGISASGTLRYNHQVLLYLPGGNGKPRAIGQFGGVVGSE